MKALDEYRTIKRSVLELEKYVNADVKLNAEIRSAIERLRESMTRLAAALIVLAVAVLILGIKSFI